MSAQRARADKFPVVGVGASAGGLEAFKRFLSELPPDPGMAFLLVQHLAPHHESHLADLLGRGTRLPVIEASHRKAIEVNHVYVIPPDADMTLANGVLDLTLRADVRGPHLPIDHLFRSLAQDQQARAIGVVLSGTGSDGTLGLCEIKAVGGITFAQDERSALHPGMPASATESGCADFVLPPEAIAQRLLKIGSHPYLATPPLETPEGEEGGEDIVAEIVSIVRKVAGVDFGLYRESTIRRRIERRMALASQRALPGYIERLKADRDEVIALYHDLLVNVTSFFREPEMFETLKRVVFPQLAKRKSPSHPYRIWVPGCSTGQEAYSLAMTLLEFHERDAVRPPIQIFATDLSDQRALDRARNGVYPDTIEAEVSPERLRRYFVKEDRVYRIDKAIREMCVFARQNVAADPPFSHLDLISCRNVLIYLASPLQRRIMATFHYALDSPGFLVLGAAESLGNHEGLFDLVDETYKIYARKPAPSRLGTRSAEDQVAAASVFRRRGAVAAPIDFQKEADRILLGRFAPPSVLVDENLEILHFRGRTSAYLESPPGAPTSNLLEMAKEGVFLALRSAFEEAKVTRARVRREDVRVLGDGGAGRVIAIEVLPVLSADELATFLVLFHDPQAQTATAGPAAGAPPAAGEETEAVRTFSGAAGREVERLRQELFSTREYLRSLAEQKEAANAELRTANEEILSNNEELQSTNEELETAKEELQATNEEFNTVNAQLNHRNAELTQLNDDLTNLLSSANVPIVMVGSDLRVRRFTAGAGRLMNLLPTDVGRPIIDIRAIADIGDIEATIAGVIERMEPTERELKDRDGRWQMLRVFPYRTLDNRIDGAVILLMDIDQIRRGQEELEHLTAALQRADRRKDQFLATLAHELRNPIAPLKNAVEIMHLAGGDPATMTQVREMLDRQVRQLAGIVEDLIDISRIVERKIELRISTVRLDEIINTAVDTARGLIDSCGHTLTVKLPDEPLVLDADPVRLSQVFANLLNNAAKFTPPGGAISVTAQAVQDGGESGRTQAVIRVRDSGIGISESSAARIFEMFEQGPGLEQRGSGLGVGLTLARSLVQMHGGTIEVRSGGLGKGSEFVVVLPAANSTAPGPSDDAARPRARRESGERILIVDDNRDQADSLATLLRLLGHEVRLCYDGEEALRIAAEFLPDAVLLDLGLPKLSGYEVAERMSQDPRLEDALLIAQTGWGQEQDRERTRRAGFDYHLVKPVDVDEVECILAGARNERTS